MNILVASSEAVPFSKTGGLADVSGALPVEIARRGHNVSLFTPAYREVFQSGLRIDPTEIRLDIPIGNRILTGYLLSSHLPDSNVPVYLIQQDSYFDRAQLYQEEGHDYKDNCERYVFFCRAVMESIRLLDLPVDVLHCNDWQTGLIPALQRIEYGHVPRYEQIATVFTLHNMAYQGQFWHWDMLLTGLDWKYFNWHQMEYFSKLNLLKTGIVFADILNTVSPQYAFEIQHEPHGCGLESVLRHRRNVLSGIINGVDYRTWNPESDDYIASNYSVRDWQQGKSACKAQVQTEFGLPVEPNTPMVGFVGRLVEQKGISLVTELIEQWGLSENVQWVILGTGDRQFEEQVARLSALFPRRVGSRIGFSNALAHQIEAGCDLFLMPSRYEPCGLNQLYSLKYGTVPVVHATGGLVDTITNATPETIRSGEATGYRFDRYTTEAFDQTLRRACNCYRQQPEDWARIVEAGMRQDWSWSRSAGEYEGLYQQAIARVKETVCV
ncbi:MAG: glycogen synthase GlgA [Planctomycetota bacterium]|nr:glycogen synthase GlgA [Planctomycetota bacterium]MDA1178486.1 glycogen synthase GlgA [Planctomycetota bacterium]